jgi:hypothetical protein
MNAGTEDPDCGIGSVPVIGWTSMARVCDYGGQKRLCWLYNVRKLYRPLSLCYRVKFVRNRFASYDTFQKLCRDRFFHHEYYADLSQTCSRGCILGPSAIECGHRLQEKPIHLCARWNALSSTRWDQFPGTKFLQRAPNGFGEEFTPKNC